MKAFQQIAAAVALCVLGTAPVFAQGTTFINGSFTSGLTPGWTSHGDVSVVGSRKVVSLTTASLDFQDDSPLPAGFNNNSGTAAVDFFDPAAAGQLAGISFANLDAAGGGTTYEGSAIRQNFFATAGDTLTVTFDWTFLSTETGPLANPDFAFIAVNDTVVKFVDAFSAPAVSMFTGTFGDLNQVAWGWTTASYTYTAASSGAVSLVLGLADVGDSSYTSELRVDNFTVSAVPEPETYAMLLAGLGLVGAFTRRRKSKANEANQA